MVQKDLPSPLITHLSWKKMTVEGIGSGKFREHIFPQNQSTLNHLIPICPIDKVI
jgi:hypothetical protein